MLRGWSQCTLHLTTSTLLETQLSSVAIKLQKGQTNRKKQSQIVEISEISVGKPTLSHAGRVHKDGKH